MGLKSGADITVLLCNNCVIIWYIWNKLHNDFKVDDYYDFKRLLKNEIADCNCNTCMFCMIKHL